MMPVAPAPEPEPFHTTVRVRGLRAIHERCGLSLPPELHRPIVGRPHRRAFTRGLDGKQERRPATRPEELSPDDFPPYWREAIPWLLVAHQHICAYTCFRIHAISTPTVDHWAPISRAWDRVYEWENYRLACQRVNATKGTRTDVLDPFTVQPGWFALDLVLGQVIPGPAACADPALHQRVQHTIQALRLSEYDEERMWDIENYQKGDVTLALLKQNSPFVALELIRQNQLHPNDAIT